MISTLCIFFFGSVSQAREISVSEFLDAVEQNNRAVKALEARSEGLQLRVREGNLIYAPHLNADASRFVDESEKDFVLQQGTRTKDNRYSVGLNQQTPWGLSAAFNFKFDHVSIEGASSSFVPVPDYYKMGLSADLTLNLLRNFWGSETEAKKTVKNAANTAESLASAFEQRQTMYQAEQSFWRLAVAREILKVQKSVLERAEKIYNWAANRAKLQLGDRSDMLQAKATVELRRIDLTLALEEERAASFAFNQALDREGREVPESLRFPPISELLRVEQRERASERLDVGALREQGIAASASTQLTKEHIKPSIDVFANYTHLGKDVASEKAYSEAWQGRNPVTTLGVRLTMPLSFGLMTNVYSGAAKEQAAANLRYEKRRREADAEWEDLQKKLQDTKERLKLSLIVEEAQKNKLDNERTRLLRGRSTTYQTVLFEQDYTAAVVLRLRTQAELLRIASQLKLFGEKSW